MKCIITLALACFLLSIQLAYSETIYVTENLRIMVRKSPNPNGKIIAMPKSGTALQLLDVNGSEWSRIELADGKKGWVLSRYTSTEIPSKIVIEQLRAHNSMIESKLKAFVDYNGELIEQRDKLQIAVSKSENAFVDISNKYETLRDESKEYLSLRASYNETSNALSNKKEQARYLEGEVERLNNDKAFEWFFGGSAVILIGFLLGYAAKKPKRLQY